MLCLNIPETRLNYRTEKVQYGIYIVFSIFEKKSERRR